MDGPLGLTDVGHKLSQISVGDMMKLSFAEKLQFRMAWSPQQDQFSSLLVLKKVKGWR